MEDIFEILLKIIRGSEKKSMIIAIDGRCAAGKTTLAEKIREKTDCNVIHMDHFFLRPEQRTTERLKEPGGNVDYERFLQEVMVPLSKNLPFSYRIFSCSTMSFSGDVKILSDKVTLVEGSYSCHPKLWNFYDLRVFLSIDRNEQLNRILQRNGEKALKNFSEKWIPLEEKYFTEFHIQERCDYSFECLK